MEVLSLPRVWKMEEEGAKYTKNYVGHFISPLRVNSLQHRQTKQPVNSTVFILHSAVFDKDGHLSAACLKMQPLKKLDKTSECRRPLAAIKGIEGLE